MTVPTRNPQPKSACAGEDWGCGAAVPIRGQGRHEHEVLALGAFELLQIPVHRSPSWQVCITADDVHPPSQHAIIVWMQVA